MMGDICKIAIVLFFLISGVFGESPYRFFTWNITYGDIHPLGVKQQGILINDKFPGPPIDAVTNDNIVINVFNQLNEPFLISWNGVQQRKNSWQDGVIGTTCPIPPGKNFTYKIQFKDQIGSYYYFPSLAFHKAAGAFGAISISSRPQIPVPFPPPDDDFSLLIGDWYKTNHDVLRRRLDSGRNLPMPDGVLINGRGWGGNTFTVKPGKTYRLRISNVGVATSLNFGIQGHTMKLVEVEGTHTIQNNFTSIDVHLGQSYSVLVTANQAPQDYYIVISSRFTRKVLTTTSILHYSNSIQGVFGPVPNGPTLNITSSLFQAQSIRKNLTASGPRPNPQGSYHYGLIKPDRTVILANSALRINGKQRYAVNGASFLAPDTPLKLADYFNISGVFNLGSIPTSPPGGNGGYLETSVMASNRREFVEIVFQNSENSVQSWHISGHSCFVLGMDGGQWTPESRKKYNLLDAVSRSTVQVYPKAWTAIYVALDNVGMWNIRSENWARQYLGQQFYLRVYTSRPSYRVEYPPPKNVLMCGRAQRGLNNTEDPWQPKELKPLDMNQFFSVSLYDLFSWPIFFAIILLSLMWVVVVSYLLDRHSTIL